MGQKLIVESAQDRLRAWRDVEKAAQEAETELKGIGKKAADTNRLYELAFRAKSLRQEADRLFAAILRSVAREDDPPNHLQLGRDEGRSGHSN
jgi:adenylosuccinate lyase